jgi:hypothetical protein
MRVLLASLLVSALVAGCSQTSTSTSTSPPEQSHRPTLFGTNVWRAPGEGRAQAMARVDATYGRVAVARIFSPQLPDPWPSLKREVGDRPVVVSFRLPPAEILSGAADAPLRAWFRAAPRDRDTFWAYFHEPEDSVERGEFTAEDFAAAWSHVADLAAEAHNPRLRATMILMCWTAQPGSGRSWRDYVPDTGAVKVLAWDCYAKGDNSVTYADPADLLDPAREASADAGAGWGIAELGARSSPTSGGGDRAEWLTDIGTYAQEHGARFVTLFDAPIGGEFRVTDQSSIAAWADLVAWSRAHQRGRHRMKEAQG